MSLFSHFGGVHASPGRVLLAGLLWVAMAGVAVGQTPAGAQEAMSRGTSAMQAADFRTAVNAFTEVTHKMPAFAEGYFNLGLALEQAGELDKANAALKRATELKPGLHGANLFRGLIAYRQNRFKDAEALLERETRLSPQDAKAWMWLGVCRLAEDNARGAIEPLEKAKTLDPKDVDVLYHLGHAYLKMANQSYAAMFDQGRDSERVHQVLAEAYASGFRTQAAIGEYELAVKMAPRQPGLHEDLGDQYWIQGDLNQAAEGYAKELEIDPFSVSAMYKLGSLKVLYKKPEEGVALLQRALTADPTLNDAHYYLATGLEAEEQNEAAIGEFAKAIAADPDSDRAMSANYKLGQLYRKLHRTDEAKSALARYQELKANEKTRDEKHMAEIVRNRAKLPVEVPEEKASAEE